MSSKCLTCDDSKNSTDCTESVPEPDSEKLDSAYSPSGHTILLMSRCRACPVTASSSVDHDSGPGSGVESRSREIVNSVSVFVPPIQLDPLNLENDQMEAYQKYRDSVTVAMKVSVDPRALTEDFIRMVKMYTRRTTVDTTLMEIPENYKGMYNELLTKYFAPVFESVPSGNARGAGFQVFRIDRVVDFTRDETTGEVLWTTIDNLFRFTKWSLTGSKETITIDLPAINFDGSSIKFFTSDLKEHVDFMQMAMPSGLVVWKCEHYLGRNMKMRAFLTEILL